MDDLADVRRCHTRLGTNLMQAVDDGVFGGDVSGQNLGRKLLALDLDHHVGEGAADIDAHANCAVAHVYYDPCGCESIYSN